MACIAAKIRNSDNLDFGVTFLNSNRSSYTFNQQYPMKTKEYFQLKAVRNAIGLLCIFGLALGIIIPAGKGIPNKWMNRFNCINNYGNGLDVNKILCHIMEGELDKAVIHYEEIVRFKHKNDPLHPTYLQAVTIIFRIKQSQSSCNIAGEDKDLGVRQAVWAMIDHLRSLSSDELTINSVFQMNVDPIILERITCSLPPILLPIHPNFEKATRECKRLGILNS